MTKSEIIKQLAADLKESAERNKMQREGGHYVKVDNEMATDQYRALAMATFEFRDNTQIRVRCDAGILTISTGNVEVISSLIENLLQ